MQNTQPTAQPDLRRDAQAVARQQHAFHRLAIGQRDQQALGAVGAGMDGERRRASPASSASMAGSAASSDGGQEARRAGACRCPAAAPATTAAGCVARGSGPRRLRAGAVSVRGFACAAVQGDGRHATDCRGLRPPRKRTRAEVRAVVTESNSALSAGGCLLRARGGSARPARRGPSRPRSRATRCGCGCRPSCPIRSGSARPGCASSAAGRVRCAPAQPKRMPARPPACTRSSRCCASDGFGHRGQRLDDAQQQGLLRRVHVAEGDAHRCQRVQLRGIARDDVAERPRTEDGLLALRRRERGQQRKGAVFLLAQRALALARPAGDVARHLAPGWRPGTAAASPPPGRRPA